MPAFMLQTPLGTTLNVMTSVVLVAVMGVAVFTDLRAARIPNWLTLGSAILGLSLNLLSGGLAGGVAALSGWLVGAALLFVFFAIRVMGAGDVKLLAAAGALGGPGFALNAFVLTGLAGGFIAILVTLKRGRSGYLATKMASKLQMFNYAGGIVRNDPKDPPLRFPYGLAIAAGSIAALFWRL